MAEPASKPNESILPNLALTEDRVRAIVREEIAVAGWKHDADHGATQGARDAQAERDQAAGVAYTAETPAP